MGRQQLSRIGIYWRVWLGIVVLMLMLRCTVFFGPWGDDCGLSFAYIIVTWPPLVVLFLIERYRLLTYLERHDPRKWSELTGANSDGTSSFKGVSRPAWLSSSVDTGDPELERIKRDGLQLAYLALAMFFSNFLLFLLLLHARAT